MRWWLRFGSGSVLPRTRNGGVAQRLTAAIKFSQICRCKLAGKGARATRSAQILHKLPRLIVESGEDLIQVSISQMPINSFADDAAEVCG